MAELRFEVEGYPPSKNEALSMLSAGHSHESRVRALLHAARQAAEREQFDALMGPIGLHVVVYSSSWSDPWDATNDLGGIADVLEDKARRGPLEHLGDLAKFSLYRNDRQIKEIQYRQVAGEKPQYGVRIWSLTDIPSPDGSEDLLRRITINSDTLGGKPTIRGRRLAVEHVLGMLAAGDSPETLMAGYPWMEREDVLACLAYAYQVVAGARFASETDETETGPGQHDVRV